MAWYVLVSPDRYSSRSIGAIKIDLDEKRFQEVLAQTREHVDMTDIEKVVEYIRWIGFEVEYINPDKVVILDPYELEEEKEVSLKL